MAPPRIPFDSLTLAAVVFELRTLVGARLQRIAQIDESTVVLGFYAERRERFVLLSCDARFFRVHLVSGGERGISPPPPFCQALRKHLTDIRLTKVVQVGLDRILRLEFEGEEGKWVLLAELMGKHSNLILVGPDGKVHGAAKWVGSTKSRRPITPGRTYEPPPFPPRKPLWEAMTLEELRAADGASPFLVTLISRECGLDEAPSDGALGETAVSKLAELRRQSECGEFQPVAVEGMGAYPVSVRALGYSEQPTNSLSAPLEAYYSAAQRTTSLVESKASLLGQLRRVLIAREVAVRSLEEASDAAKRASNLQLMGEMLLAFAAQIPPEAKEWTGEDWEGNAVQILLNAEMTPLENAQRLFDRAKRAKARSGEVLEQLERQRQELNDVSRAIRSIEAAMTLEEVEDARQDAQARRWLIVPTAREKEDRPYEGHRIRELLAPGGWKVLYGENATSNDYLTQRVARPNDWWLHVRGAVSAHVVVPSGNAPDRVPREVLVFAAKVAAKQSPSKHSSIVAVDYTLKKHVRKPRGSPAGAVLYEREKTLHVAP